MINMNRVVLLNSGGLDSALLGKMLYDEGKEIYSLWINTKTISEEPVRIAVEETARRYCVSHREIVVDFGQHSNFFEDINSVEMYDNNPTRTDKLWICPNHPLLNNTIGTAYGKTINAVGCYTGVKQKSDFYKIESYNQALLIGVNKFYRTPLVAPLYYFDSYEQILEKINASFHDFSYTYSCTYAEPCGTCYKCVEREERRL